MIRRRDLLGLVLQFFHYLQILLNILIGIRRHIHHLSGALARLVNSRLDTLCHIILLFDILRRRVGCGRNLLHALRNCLRSVHQFIHKTGTPLRLIPHSL